MKQEPKRLFTNDEWNDEGQALARELSSAIKPIVKQWATQGYSLRDIFYVLVAEANEAHLYEIICKKHPNETERRLT